MSRGGARRLRWLLPVALVAAGFAALALHPGADLEPEVRRFLSTVEAGTPEALGTNTSLYPLWDPAEVQDVANYLRRALGSLRSIESLSPAQRVDRPGMPRREAHARLLFTRVAQPAEARFEFIRTESGWSVSDFEIRPPPGAATGAQRDRAGPEAERLASLATRLAFPDLHQNQLRAVRRRTSLDDFTARLTPHFEGLSLAARVVLVSTEPHGEGVRAMLRASYPEGAVRTMVIDLQAEDGRWRLASIDVRQP